MGVTRIKQNKIRYIKDLGAQLQMFPNLCQDVYQGKLKNLERNKREAFLQSPLAESLS